MTGLEETTSSEYKGKIEFCPDALGVVASSGAIEDPIASPRAMSCWEGDYLHAVLEERQELCACQVAARALVLMPAQFLVLMLAAYPRLILAFLGWGSYNFWKPPLPGAILHYFDPGFHTQRRC
jgi:hypothetical protein